jgi:hypothetical protein
MPFILKNKRRNKYSQRLNVPVVSQKPITMGVGSTVINITSMKTATIEHVNSFLINNMIATSHEYTIKRNSYQYMKINYIKVIFSVSGINSDSMDYLLINWVNDNDMSVDQIRNSDNVKQIPIYRPRNKIFTFIPPNTEVNGINPSRYQSTQTTPYIGTIYLAGSFGVSFRVEINISFRGSRDFDIANAIKELKVCQDMKEIEEKNNKIKELENNKLLSSK